MILLKTTEKATGSQTQEKDGEGTRSPRSPVVRGSTTTKICNTTAVKPSPHYLPHYRTGELSKIPTGVRKGQCISCHTLIVAFFLPKSLRELAIHMPRKTRPTRALLYLIQESAILLAYPSESPRPPRGLTLLGMPSSKLSDL